MQKIYLFLLISCFAFKGYSQTAAAYLETPTISATYNDISGITGVTSVPVLCDDCNVTGIPIGFTFKFCGANYTTLAASSNGFLSLYNSPLAPYMNAPANITGVGFIMPFWDNLSGVFITGSFTTPAAYCITRGAAPNRVFTFEWQDFNVGLSTCTTCTGNFQVNLYETSNMVEFVYGFMTYSGMTATIGIANSATDWQTLDNTGFYPTPSSTVFTASLATGPATGQIYRWLTPCVGTPTPGTVHASDSAGCPGYYSLLTLTGGEDFIGGIVKHWQYSPDGITWTTIPAAPYDTCTVLVLSNMYYRSTSTCSYSGFSASTPSVILSADTVGPITGLDTVLLGGTITVSDTAIGGKWSSGSTLIATISAGGLVTGKSLGTATITFTKLGCDITKTIYVAPLPDLVAVNKNAGAGLSIFPNPNQGIFHIRLSSDYDEEMVVAVSNITGGRITEFIAITNKEVAVRAGLPPGLYFVSAITSHANYITKLVVE